LYLCITIIWLPGYRPEINEKTREDWQRIEALANTISEQELLSLSCEEVLHRLFNEEQVRFRLRKVGFYCFGKASAR
jgi:redox-regulated HSP33 family molecular chaperone